MRLKRAWRITFRIAGLVAALSLVIFLLVRFVPEPPAQKVELARLALSEATANKADTYSRKLFREARSLYDSAMINWQAENERFIYFRDYGRVSEFAEQSARKARQAAKISKNNVTDLNIYLGQKIGQLNRISELINIRFSAYPLSPEVWKDISRGKMLLKESEVSYNKGDYAHSRTRLAEADLLLSGSYEKAVRHLSDYFTSYPQWKKWVDKTIGDSRRNSSYAIIVDKYSRKCIVYHSGVKKYEYTAELGPNWVGDKRMKGDKATPEGLYRVTKKLGNSRTKYHKALLIDYPNAADREEFRQELAKGTLPKNARIGSLIEIHGDGGRGVDWTDGCVALTNSEMDVVYKIASEGTPVTIVGSTLSYEQLFE
ncbi:MAG: L,D-transpeptidase family protein [Bacteroidales bacterium]|jgi:hypothetical protein|nr:L,D-transpeptidase family protein [Bacteroidales bacterium]